MVFALNRLWVFGGFQSGEFYNDLYSLNLKTLTWESMTSKLGGVLPTPRQMQAMTYSNIHLEENL